MHRSAYDGYNKFTTEKQLAFKQSSNDMATAK
jgi:hypothetical protein